MANPKRKSLMAALTEYQNENYYSKPGQRGMTKDGDSKADIAEARKRQAQVKAQAAKKKQEKKKNDPPKTTNTGSGSGSRTRTNSGSRGGTSASTSKNDRVSKFLGGQTVQQMADKRKTKTDKEKAATANKQQRGLLNKQGQTLAQQRAARQAELNKRLKKKREEEKKRRQKSRSNWAKGQLKGL